MAEFISRCEEFLIEEFSPLDSQWSSEEFLSLSSNGLQKGLFCTKIKTVLLEVQLIILITLYCMILFDG